jgi:hypothetical protein
LCQPTSFLFSFYCAGPAPFGHMGPVASGLVAQPGPPEPILSFLQSGEQPRPPRLSSRSHAASQGRLRPPHLQWNRRCITSLSFPLHQPSTPPLHLPVTSGIEAALRPPALKPSRPLGSLPQPIKEGLDLQHSSCNSFPALF